MVLRLVLFGAPGAGKGTQAALLAKRFHAAHLSTGDLFRNAISARTPVGILAKSFIDAGSLVPDDVVMQMVTHKLEAELQGRSFVFDGFPRTLEQAMSLDAFLARTEEPLSRVISLEVAPTILLQRLAGRRLCPRCNRSYHVSQFAVGEVLVCLDDGEKLVQRSDDREEAVKTRLEAFLVQTMPLKRYYEEQGLLVSVAGEGSANEVFARICAVLERNISGEGFFVA